MTDTAWASELRGELERAVANYHSRTKWYLAAAAGGAAVIALIVALVGGSGSPPQSQRTTAPAANAAPRTSSPSTSGAIGDLGDVPVGEPANTLAAAQSRATFNILVPKTADANAQNVTAIYADPSAVEMRFPPPDEQSKQLNRPYIDVIEHNGDGSDAPITVQQELTVLEQYFKAAGDEVGPKLVSACNVGALPALCIAAADRDQQPAECSGTHPVVCSGPHPDTALVRFVDGNVDVQISGGTRLDRLIEIGESMASAGSTDRASHG